MAVTGAGAGEGDRVSEPLVVSLGVVVVDEPSEDGSQVMLAEWDEVPEALVLGRANGPVGVGVEVPGWWRAGAAASP